MAKYDVATLAVKLVGDAQGFEKMITGAEKRLTGFADKIASPMNMIRGLGGNLMGAITNPMSNILTDAQRLVSAMPGMQQYERLIDPVQQAQAFHEAFERTDRLVREAERLDVSPRFLRAIEQAAEDDAAAVTGALGKFQKSLGELKQGSKEAVDKFKQAGLNPADFVNASMEEAVLKYADHYSKLEDRALQASTAVSLLGKAGMQAHGAFKDGAESISKYVTLLEKMNVYGFADKALADKYEQVERLAKLMQEAAEQQAFVKYGAAGMIGSAKIKAGIPGGWTDYLQSWHAYILDWMPGIKSASYMPREVKDMMGGAENKKTKPIFDPDAASAQATIAAQQAAAASADKQRADNLQSLMLGYEQSLKTFGMSELGIKVQEAFDLGASFQQMDKLRANIDALDGKKMEQSLVTPMEKYEKELDRVSGMHHRGVLSSDMYERALRKLGKATESKSLEGLRESGVDLVGSQEWAKAFNRQSPGEEKVDEQQLDEMKRQTTLQERIDQALKQLNENKPKVLVAGPGGIGGGF